jgi:hypothetical protein
MLIWAGHHLDMVVVVVVVVVLVVVVVVVNRGPSLGKDAFFGGAHRASFAAVTRSSTRNP